MYLLLQFQGLKEGVSTYVFIVENCLALHYQ